MLYNGTVFPGYGEPNGVREREVGALETRLTSSLYQSLIGGELEARVMDFPRHCHYRSTTSGPTRSRPPSRSLLASRVAPLS